MLQTRRLLAFSSRVHTYTLLLYLFFFLVYITCSYFLVQKEFISLLQFALDLTGWTNLLFGFWIIVFSCIVWVTDSVFPFSPVLLTCIRMAIVFLLSVITAIIENLITNGFVIS
ncbi:hypothetical protein SpiGrapes_0451 [Sphaerochaeta pleomorpha str. Grapes]|uniref:Uncharacterized protein n=1 Tax=Sphaerochaeta pleomorpha (strain ATCC BAA-1885 / DSM 22778 / Grapes) TaxID=158190 RepID=G8QW63_SPHPG|nr:hypothetical protein [Sphaerochaeta pleomorpha]AEV28306.1 hypothetical protein SpiGrapes_0451 [Sphaerochaeta pleomorpha str. Grapes]